jgi:hypothetical protein
MYASLTDFKAAAERFAALRAAHQLRIVIGPQGGLGFAIDGDASDVPEPGGGLYADINDALLALATGHTIEQFVERRGKARGPSFPEREDAKTARAKYKAVAALFDPSELAQKVILRRTSNIQVLTNIEWETITRQQYTVADKSSSPIGLIKLTAERPTESPFSSDRDTLVCVLDLEDVAYLEAQLRRLRASVAQEEESDGIE